MKTVVVAILSLMMLSASAYASPISQNWIKTYGGTDEDLITCIQQTMDGGYIAAGHTRSFAPGLTIYIMVLKLDANGNVSWQKTYHSDAWISDASTIQQTPDGGYILAGINVSISSISGGWILKLASNGDIVWQKIYEEVTEFKSLQQPAEGGYIAVGDTSVLRLNSDGSILWEKQIGGLQHLSLEDIQQTPDGGYIVIGQHLNTGYGNYDILVLRFDSNGNLLWQKTYRGPDDEISEFPNSILIMSEGGYLIAAQYGIDALVFKIDENGTIVWQKIFGGYGYDAIHHIKELPDGRYFGIGVTEADDSGDDDLWLVQIRSTGSIGVQLRYGGDGDDSGVLLDETIDGGHAIAANTNSFGVAGNSLMIWKMGLTPPFCDIWRGYNDLHVVTNRPIIDQDISLVVQSTISSVTATDAIPEDISVETSVVCSHVDPDDIDGDGIENNLGETSMSSLSNVSFLVDTDNCPEAPNGPFLGTCTKGNVGSTCITDVACGVGGVCSMSQEDSYPPLGNGIGDSCDCEGDFDCDGDCDGTDAATFKSDFGRSGFNNPCINEDQCNGDFDCDNDCDGTDAALFKKDFGRSGFNNPCPACFQGGWCMYHP